MRAWWTAVVWVWAGCGEEPPAAEDTNDSDAAGVVGRCDYTNTFSQGPECKEYIGSGWTAESAAAQCDAGGLAQSPGTFTAGAACGTEDILGRCVIDGGTADEVALVFPGTDPAGCGGASIGCGFGGGVFEPSPVCAGDTTPPSNLPVFQIFEQSCVQALPDEPPGATDGEVCTWGAISACTEPGRDFRDYQSCDTVLTQRPYAPYEVAYTEDPSDPRLADPLWLEENAWVTDEVKACACLCCHSETAPEGPSGWYLEAGTTWIDTVDDDGLAMLAGWIDSSAFGAFPPEENNGFDRSTTGLPTSDVARMTAFLEGELARRGRTRQDFANAEPFGGPLYDQLVYEPTTCANGEGVGPDGAVTWSGGGARYVYVLEQGSNSPGVPPNLDTPEGTLWRVDVAPSDDPISSGVTFGVAPAGARQVVPAAGSPTLTSGETYYLVALRDVYQPITRCLFTAP